MTEQDPLDIALQRAKQERARCIEAEKQNGKTVEISRKGYWRVPPSRRPKGWESMGLKEPVGLWERGE